MRLGKFYPHFLKKRIYWYWLLVLSFFFFPVAQAQDLTDFEPDDDVVSGQNFTIDATNQAGAGDIIQLEFGESLGEYLQFDIDDDRFELSNDLSLEGFELEDFRVENAASDPEACSGGVEGRLYYNTGSNELQICDGSSWGGISGGGSGVDQTNVVYVDGTRTAQAGEVYNTLASAVAYINTQSPGSGNPWVILMEPGTNAESVTIPTYTVLVGRDRESTTMTGTITLSANAAIQNLTIGSGGELDIGSGNTGYVTASDVNIDDGASGGIDGTLVISESFVDGTIGATGVVQVYESTVGPTSLTNNGSIGTYHSTVLNITNNSIWNNFATAYDNSVLSADDQLDATNTQEAIDELVLGTPADNFVIDENQGLADDVAIQFGSIVGESLEWNESNARFQFSNSLFVAGSHTVENISGLDSFRVNDQASDSTPFIIDQDGNVGIGTDAPVQPVDIQNDVLLSTPEDGVLQITSTQDNTVFQVESADGGATSRPIFRMRGDDLLDKAFMTQLEGESLGRYNLEIGGSMQWGPGSAARDVELQRTDVGTLQIQNDSTLTTDSGLQINNQAAGDLDPKLEFQLSGTSEFSLGVDDSDADKFVLSEGGDIGDADDRLEIEVGGNFSVNTNGSGRILFGSSVDFDDQTSDPGSPLEGETWFRSDLDQLRIFADGRTQELGFVEVGQFYDSDGNGGSFNINTASYTAIPWDTQSFTPDATYSHSTTVNPSRVTVNDSGLYKISYAVHAESSGGRRNVRCRVRLNGNDSLPSGVQGDSFSYSRNGTDEWATNTASILVNVSAGQYYEVVCRQEGSAGTAVLSAGAEGSSWTSIELFRRE